MANETSPGQLTSTEYYIPQQSGKKRCTIVCATQKKILFSKQHLENLRSKCNSCSFLNRDLVDEVIGKLANLLFKESIEREQLIFGGFAFEVKSKWFIAKAEVERIELIVLENVNQFDEKTKHSYLFKGYSISSEKKIVIKIARNSQKPERIIDEINNIYQLHQQVNGLTSLIIQMEFPIKLTVGNQFWHGFVMEEFESLFNWNQGNHTFQERLNIAIQYANTSLVLMKEGWIIPDPKLCNAVLRRREKNIELLRIDCDGVKKINHYVQNLLIPVHSDSYFSSSDHIILKSLQQFQNRELFELWLEASHLFSLAVTIYLILFKIFPLPAVGGKGYYRDYLKLEEGMTEPPKEAIEYPKELISLFRDCFRSGATNRPTLAKLCESLTKIYENEVRDSKERESNEQSEKDFKELIASIKESQ